MKNRRSSGVSELFAASSVLMLFVLGAVAYGQLVSANEKSAVSAVTSLVKQTCSQAKIPEWTQIADPRLHENACKQAEEGTTKWRTGCGVLNQDGHELDCFSYSTADPAQADLELSPWIVRQEKRNARRFAVRVCWVSDPSTPQGRYRITIGAYMGRARSLFDRIGWGLAHLWSQ